jgi:hypothetical protein
MRREEFAHRARRPSFRRRCGSDEPGTAGPTAADRYLQRRLSASILPGFLVRLYTPAVTAPFSTHPICTPDYPIPTPALGSPFFSEAFSFYVEGPVDQKGEEACKARATEKTRLNDLNL